jgi:hypothetical protein
MSKTDEELVEEREVIMHNVEIWLGHEHRREDFRRLLEIEREITLREK